MPEMDSQHFLENVDTPARFGLKASFPSSFFKLTKQQTRRGGL
jgi:hypothetical protein